jgi:hypothetical protein
MRSRITVSRFVLGAALLAGFPAARAMAQQTPEVDVHAVAPPATPAAETVWVSERPADVKAAEWQRKAEEYKAMGGAAYRAGLVQNAEAQAAKYAAEARLTKARAAVDPATLLVLDAMAARYDRRVAEYRNMGGAAYKAGLVQKAEAEARKYQVMATAPAGAPVALYHEVAPFKPWLN